jgi:hypothetical protein
LLEYLILWEYNITQYHTQSRPHTIYHMWLDLDSP